MNNKLDNYNNAIIEAIYNWNRTEGYYHTYFSKLDLIFEDKKLLNFFTTKIFHNFLREYSVRRNIKKDDSSVDTFIYILIKDEFYNNDTFFNAVKAGKTEIIDVMSNKLKDSNDSITNSKESRSLLSKIAFLINPTSFSLQDTLVKESLWKEIKKKSTYKKYQIEKYDIYLEAINQEIQSLDDEHIVQVLNKFINTSAYNFFTNNPEAFKRRIFDKFLWIEHNNTRDMNNESYKQFLELDTRKIK